MMVSTKGRYALRVMIELAGSPRDEYRPLKEMAERQQISMKYLEAIAALLNRAGLVRSQRGKDGGYQLTRPAREITVGEILRAAEGTLAPVACPSLGGNACQRAEECLTLPLWQALDKKIDDYLSTVTLEDLLQGRVEV